VAWLFLVMMVAAVIVVRTRWSSREAAERLSGPTSRSRLPTTTTHEELEALQRSLFRASPSAPATVMTVHDPPTAPAERLIACRYCKAVGSELRRDCESCGAPRQM
jgi:hypothetical protein